MKKSSLKELLVPALMLFIIAAVCTALLGYTNQLTKDKIAAIQAETDNAAKATVLSVAKSFSDAKTVTVDGTEYTYFEGLDENGALLGYVIPVSTKSYGGDLSCTVGIGLDAKVTGVTITEINDTAGLGLKAKNEDFLKQYIGKAVGITVNKNASSDTEIQAITSATITSKAVTSAVNSAFDVFNAAQGGAVENG